MLLDANNNMNRHMSPLPSSRQNSADHHRKQMLEPQLSKERNLSAERAHAIERSQDRYNGVANGSGGGGSSNNVNVGQQVYKEREIVEVRRLPDEEGYLR